MTQSNRTPGARRLGLSDQNVSWSRGQQEPIDVNGDLRRPKWRGRRARIEPFRNLSCQAAGNFRKENQDEKNKMNCQNSQMHQMQRRQRHR